MISYHTENITNVLRKEKSSRLMGILAHNFQDCNMTQKIIKIGTHEKKLVTFFYYLNK